MFLPATLLLLLSLSAYLWTLVRVPYDLPPSIPTIPFYVSFCDLIRGIGRTKFYDLRLRRLMEDHGAVNVWIHGRWSVLVAKPHFLVNVFRNQQTIAKMGFDKKVPYGVFATYLGENIINAHGDLWKEFSAILKPGIQQPTDVSSIRRKTSSLATLLMEEQCLAGPKMGIKIGSLAQRWAISVYAEQFLDWQLDGPRGVDAEITELQTRIKGNFPHPFISDFPLLEYIPRLSSWHRAFADVKKFETRFLDLLRQEARPGTAGNEGKMIYALNKAHDEGRISEYHYRSNMKILFVAGHENAQQAFISLVWELAAHSRIQEELREEVNRMLPREYTAADVDSLPLLAAVVYEGLRLFPPLSQLTNRRTTTETYLGDGITLPGGVWVGWSAYGVHTNRQIWGPGAREFRPARWGNSVREVHRMFRKQQACGNYIPFTAYSRRCLGSKFALLQLKIGLCEMLRLLRWEEDPSWKFNVPDVGVTPQKVPEKLTSIHRTPAM